MSTSHDDRGPEPDATGPEQSGGEPSESALHGVDEQDVIASDGDDDERFDAG